MGNIYVNECAETESQNCFVLDVGRMALVPSYQSMCQRLYPGLLRGIGLLGKPEQCVDLVYMRATENNPVGLYSCAGLGNTGAADKGINWPLVNVTA
jgi:hypothetical protein